MTSASVSYRIMPPALADGVYALVTASFNRYVREDCTPEGGEEFFRAAREMIFNRPRNHFIIIAESGTAVAGMIDVRDSFHISLLFVDPAWMGRGIARELLDRAVRRIREQAPDIRTLEVNSSLYAVPVYEKLGFTRNRPAQEINGIRFVEMNMDIHGNERSSS